MGYGIVEERMAYGDLWIVRIFADAEADLAILPKRNSSGLYKNKYTRVAPWSTCTVISTGDVYVLSGSTDTWDKIGGGEA